MDAMLKRNKFIAKIWREYRKMAGPFTGWRAVYERKRRIYPKPPQPTQSSRDSGPARTPRSPVPASASQERIGLTEMIAGKSRGQRPRLQKKIRDSVRVARRVIRAVERKRFQEINTTDLP